MCSLALPAQGVMGPEGMDGTPGTAGRTGPPGKEVNLQTMPLQLCMVYIENDSHLM